MARFLHGAGTASAAPALVLLALLVAGCAGSAAGDAGPVATTTVDLPKSYRFAPQAITVPAGATVTWTNNDNFTHSVRLADGEPQFMAPGEGVTRTFPTPGLYRYDCSLHSSDMSGSVLVTEN